MRFRRLFQKPDARAAGPTTTGPRQDSLDISGAIGNQAVARDLKGNGQPLPASTRGQMESALGGSFKDVRVHTDNHAARQAEEMGASAFTIGSDIAFNRGEYKPGTPGGDALIAHELAHVAQQRGAVTAGHDSPALEADATRAGIHGVAALWGGMRSRLAGVGPALRSGLAVQRCSCTGQKMPAKAGAGKKAGGKDTAPADDKDPMAAEKAGIAKQFGLSRIGESGGGEWKAGELAKVRKILAKLPAEGKAAIQGVALIRVVTPNCGGDHAGCFREIVNKKTGEREDVIELGDQAFSGDKELEEKDKDVKVTRTDLSGAKMTALPSEEVLLHEVGHGVERAQARKAISDRFKKDLETTQKNKAVQDAVKALNKATPRPFRTPPAKGKELAYNNALISTSRTLNPIFDAINNLGDDPSAKALATAVTSIRGTITATKKEIVKRNKAKADLPGGSTMAQPDVESAQDAAIVAAEDLIKKFGELRDAQKALEKAKTAESATMTKLPGKDPAQQTRNVAEMVAILTLKKVDVKNSSLPAHPKDHWPKNPREVYAELYQMSIVQPAGLKVFDPDIAEYFRSPIGVKDAKLKKRVEDFIAKQNK
jgi:hypothetical protein